METWSKILAVAIGGSAGAVARYLINISPVQNLLGKFPLHTFLINIVGSFLIGLLAILLPEKFIVSESLRLALTVGFLGAFTTFSTFELETLELVRENQITLALLYLIASVGVGFLAVIGGVWLARKF